ncbi:gp53-like domain-containing protein [Citrobacter braakii]|uniref:gp53-like domain-containing protein n=1 Tax=Citrobacter braakii TaxID=57706 RepID=UPI002DBA2D46|nr:hypothetical protein [Citrobacter braakii]MEB7707731.1 hypothetical protein [Citrobacter braakii]
MFHVDNNSAVPVMPAVKPVVSAVTSFFTEGGNGVPPTYPGPDWFNIIQSELLAILAAAGISPDKASNVQLLAAMRVLFLDASQNGADIQDKAAFLQNLGLKTAAQRNVGAGDIANIPDMSFFRASMLANGYVYLPVIGAGGGAQTFMIQWGQTSAPPNSVAAYNLNVAFPNSILFAVGNRWADGSNASMNVKPLGTQQIRIQNWAPSGYAEICSWLAIGY